jgi:hypothetical protein
MSGGIGQPNTPKSSAFSRLTSRIPDRAKGLLAGGAVVAGGAALYGLHAAHDIATQVVAERLMNRSKHVARFAGRVKKLPYSTVPPRQQMAAHEKHFQRMAAEIRKAPPGGYSVEPRDERGRWTSGGGAGAATAASDATVARLLSRA